MAVFELTYRSEISSEEAMLETLQEILENHRVPLPELRKFMLVVSEAFTNALIHGNNCDSEKVIKVRLDINERALTADVIDQGFGGPDRVKGKLPSSLFSEGGRGVDLMRHCATSVEFVEAENGGMKVTVTLERRRQEKVNNR